MDDGKSSKHPSLGERLQAALEAAIFGSTFDVFAVELTWAELERDLMFGRE